MQAAFLWGQGAELTPPRGSAGAARAAPLPASLRWARSRAPPSSRPGGPTARQPATGPPACPAGWRRGARGSRRAAGTRPASEAAAPRGTRHSGPQGSGAEGWRRFQASDRVSAVTATGQRGLRGQAKPPEPRAAQGPARVCGDALPRFASRWQPRPGSPQDGDRPVTVTAGMRPQGSECGRRDSGWASHTAGPVCGFPRRGLGTHHPHSPRGSLGARRHRVTLRHRETGCRGFLGAGRSLQLPGHSSGWRVSGQGQGQGLPRGIPWAWHQGCVCPGSPPTPARDAVGGFKVRLSSGQLRGPWGSGPAGGSPVAAARPHVPAGRREPGCCRHAGPGRCRGVRGLPHLLLGGGPAVGSGPWLHALHRGARGMGSRHSTAPAGHTHPPPAHRADVAPQCGHLGDCDGQCPRTGPWGLNGGTAQVVQPTAGAQTGLAATGWPASPQAAGHCH